MKLNLEDLSKLESSSVMSAEASAGDQLQAVVKVKLRNYCPPNVLIRAKISPFILTCEFESTALAQLQKDPNVVSVSISKKLRSDQK